MLPRFPFSGAIFRVVVLGLAISWISFPILAQRPRVAPPSSPNAQQPDTRGSDVNVVVRDAHGVPVEAGAVVHLFSVSGSYNVTTATREATTAHFSNVAPGEYQLEVACPGYRKSTEQLSVLGNYGDMPVFVYLVPESDPTPSGGTPRGVTLSPQLRSDLERALQALQKKDFESARKILVKASQKAPGNPDIFYFLAVAELGLKHEDLGRENLQKALSLEPNHEMALVSLGKLQMETGATTEAITSFEKAVSTERAGWRAHFELASAYYKVKRFSNAELEASRAIRLAKTKGAAATLLLGEILTAEGKKSDAKRVLESLVSNFPSDPLVADANKILAGVENEPQVQSLSSSDSLPLPAAPEISLVTVVERPWAPPDIDNAVFDLAPQVDCNIEQILDRAHSRMKSELVDFEKFTATEHIEHQQVDRYGWPGPVRSHDFSYIVVIYPLGQNSFYLEESRGSGGDDLANFPTSLATVGLNSLGVSILQPFYRPKFEYSCEGLTNLRNQAAWQVRFEEKLDANANGIRQWKKNGKIFVIPIKGRIWISSVNYAVLRVETELQRPVPGLELTKDHLIVDYGPVRFSKGNEQLWLPWSADMYMELHGKRYHHRHFLTDYMLFGVDTAHKTGKPKEPPLSQGEASP